MTPTGNLTGTGRRCAESGVSIPELLAIMALAATLLVLSASYAIGWLGRAESRNASYTVQNFVQRARMEAVSRNRSCRFTVDTTTGQIRVLDLVDFASTTDDLILADATISTKVGFARPDSGSAVTLATISGSTYGATFDSNGALSAGAGLIALAGANDYYRVNVFGVGATSVERWNGADWGTP